MDATFTSVLTVAVPVSDQDRTKELLLGLGFVEHFDTELQPGFRWVELALPDAATHVSLVRAGPQLPAGIDTGIRLATPDAAAAHATLTGLGIPVGPLLEWPGVPLMFEFEDLDANRFYVTQST
jgi:hypothetical protein